MHLYINILVLEGYYYQSAMRLSKNNPDTAIRWNHN